MSLDNMGSPATHDNGVLITDVGNPNYTTAPTSPLLSIPRELRDEIYAYLLRCGDLAILRTSKQFGHEAKERLHHEGVCRIKMGFRDEDTRNLSFQQLWESVQNFHFRLHFGPESTPYDDCSLFRQFRLLARFNIASSLKRECLITIENKASTPQTPVCHEVYEIRGLFAELRSLSLCIRFLVAFMPRSTETSCLCGWVVGMEHNEHLDIADKNLIVDNLHTLKGRLEPVLGFTGSVGETEMELIQLMVDMGKFQKLIARKQ